MINGSFHRHSIKVPVKGKDTRVTVADEENYCLTRNPFRLNDQCPELPIWRLWKLDSLMQYLKQTLVLHFLMTLRLLDTVEEPAEGRDWTGSRLNNGLPLFRISGSSYKQKSPLPWPLDLSPLLLEPNTK